MYCKSFKRVGFRALALLLILPTVSLLMSCGSDSDSVGFSGAGDVSISVEPTSIDVGDRLLVTVEIFTINDDGIFAKIKFPNYLSYVEGTALLSVSDDESEIEPDITEDGENDDTFLIFFLAESDFDITRQGELTFELQANDAVEEGQISVDIDVDDPNVLNINEFNIENPAFQEEDGQSIEVIG